MEESQYQIFVYHVKRIETSLEKIIKLLELRNSIEVARDEMRAGAKEVPYIDYRSNTSGGTF